MKFEKGDPLLQGRPANRHHVEGEFVLVGILRHISQVSRATYPSE